MKMQKICCLAICLLASAKVQALNIYRTGSQSDAKMPTSQAVCLAGGGDDDAWAEGWKYMLNRAKGGDVVIIRGGGDRGGYENWIYKDEGKHGFPKMNSVTTISLEKASDANQPEVEKLIRNAEMVFFAGGSQTDYIDWFRNSRLEKAVNQVMKEKKVPVGGTSAGMALLAGVDYTGRYNSPHNKEGMVTANDVLQDPTGKFVEMDPSVIQAPYLEKVVTDTHFSQRKRQGRIVGLMARAAADHSAGVDATSVKGIASDEGTAFCYDESGKGHVFGAGNSFFLKGQAPIEQMQEGKPLTWNANEKAIEAYVVNGKSGQGEFDLTQWKGSGGKFEYWSVNGEGRKFPVFKMKPADLNPSDSSAPMKSSSGIK